jgi:hypothetical protein
VAALPVWPGGHATPGEILVPQLCYFIASVALTSARSDGRQNVSVMAGFIFKRLNGISNLTRV